MELFLPIAQTYINIEILLFLGVIVGIISTLLGVSGGFILTPILILFGIPPHVAVSSQSLQVVGTSATGSILYLKSGRLDTKLGNYLVLGGLVGAILGVIIYTKLSQIGYLDIIVKFIYIVLLIYIGLFMCYQLYFNNTNNIKNKSNKRKFLLHKLGFLTKFEDSKIYISIFTPLLFGFIVGIFSSLLGIGGGFILVPLLVYQLGIRSSHVVGTSLYFTIFIAAFSSILHANINLSVDFYLAGLIFLGSYIGSKIGMYFGIKLNDRLIRLLFSIVVLGVAIMLIYDISTPPIKMYEVILK